MDQRAEYLFQILEKIGGPLMEAIIETSKGDDAASAQAMASMLGKAVQVSIDLGQAMDVNPVEVGDDSLRVALAGLASSLVAGQMRQAGGVPEDTEVKKIVTALQAVLTFSDNFTPSADNAKRLADLSAKGQMVDAHQVNVQYVLAFVPVVRAVSIFSFGQAEQKLIVDISDRLVKRSVSARETLFLNATNEDDQKRAELAILSALAQIYAACHEAETSKASGMSEDATSGPSLDAVWTRFDLQSSMLESLAGSLVPGGASQGAASGGGGVTPTASTPPPAQEAPIQPPPQPPAEQPPAAPPPVQPPPAEQPPAAPPPAQDPPPAQTETASAPPAGANPMAMFAKPKEEGAAAPPPPEQPVQQPPAEQPPAAPPAAPPAQETPPAAPPPQQPPADQSSGETQQGSGDAGGSPMSFFKKEDE